MLRTLALIATGIPAAACAAGLVFTPLFVQPTPEVAPTYMINEDGLYYYPADYLVAHCVSDDYNDGSQDICYTVTVEGGALLINAEDEVVAYL